MAFKIAGSMAFKEAANRAKPILLEPIMSVEVTTPEEYMGDVIGDLNSRRGQIQGMEPRANAQVVKAMFHYLRCLVMQLTCVPKPRDVQLTPCSSPIMNRHQRVCR